MSTINFIRWSGAAGFIGGFITIVGAFLTEPFTGQYLIGGLLIILALVGSCWFYGKREPAAGGCRVSWPL